MHYRLATLALSGIALLALAACGSDEPTAVPTAAPAPTATAVTAPTPTPEPEPLNATDRVIAGLPESTPENSAVAAGSPQEAVVARFNAEQAVSNSLEGRDRILAAQDFCMPDQRLSAEEITPEFVEKQESDRRSLMSRGGHTLEGFSIGNVSALINIPTEALVFYTTYEFGEKKHDLADEWVNFDGEWYRKSCNQAI